MRSRVALRVLALALALAGLPLSLVHAAHSPTTAQVVAKALELGMNCTAGAAEVVCDGPEQYYFRSPRTVIQPVDGPLQKVYSRVDAYSNGVHDFLEEDRVWMAAIHTVGCADSAAMRKFVDTVAAQFQQSEAGGTYGEVQVGECSMLGSLVLGVTRIPYWEITSWVLPAAFPTPTPPLPTPPPPTPPPAETPTPSPTASPPPSASASPSATATTTTTPTPSTSATGTPQPSASATARPGASATPEQTVAGITFAPEPSAAALDVAEDSIPWAASVHGPADVSTEPAALGASAAMAMLLLLFMGFVGELFNNTVKANYDELIGWWQKSWPGRLTAAWARLWRPRA